MVAALAPRMAMAMVLWFFVLSLVVLGWEMRGMR